MTNMGLLFRNKFYGHRFHDVICLKILLLIQLVTYQRKTLKNSFVSAINKHIGNTVMEFRYYHLCILVSVVNPTALQSPDWFS
jgi:hypothetical protein